MSIKAERAEHANQLIQAIASHGRKFFWCKSKSRTSSIEVDARGKVWFIDDYTGKRIYTHYEGHWRGLSHGGTLKYLIEAMRDYISKGQKISIRQIAPNRGEMDGNRDMWGYGYEACAALKLAVSHMPIIENT